MTDRAKFLVYGYGNPGRRDDGLGVLFAERVEALAIGGVRIDTNYQLNAEDALAVSECDTTIFADASHNEIDGFRLTLLTPSDEIGFTTHAMAPESVLATCRNMTGACPPAYLLEIQGYEWEMAEGLSNRASANLDKALRFLEPILRSGKTDFKQLL